MGTKSTQHIIEGNQEVLDYLKKSELFGHFSETILLQLVPLSEMVHFPKGATILKEGEKNTCIYFLIRGQISVYAENEYILTMQRVGDIIGEMSIISNEPCTASVIAETPVNLFSLRAKDIEKDTSLKSTALQNILYQVFAKILTEKLNLTTFKAKQMDQILQTMDAPVIVIDSNAVIHSFNTATLNLLGYSEKELFDQSIEMILVPEDGDTFQKTGMEILIKQGSIKGIEGAFLAKDGKKTPILFSNSVMIEEDGKIQKIVCVAQDNTKGKEREERLINQKTALENRLNNLETISEE